MPCEKCGKEYEIGDWPFCPHDRGTQTVKGDSIPGGVLIHNALCNPDGSPKRYYSHTEIRKEAEKRGYTNCVEHVVDPTTGSDKNPHTQRFVSMPLMGEQEEERKRRWWEDEKRFQKELTHAANEGVE